MTLEPKTNIVLLGFMGSGKSRIGRMLALKLGLELIDVDAQIERDAQSSIQEIFEKKGEAYFRQLETAFIKNLKTRKNVIVVTGGGAPMCFDNASVLKEIGEVFFLDANFPLIVERLSRGARRPLGKTDTLEEILRLEQLYIHRRPVYANLGHRIDVNHLDQERTCKEIIERFQASNRLAKVSVTPVQKLVGNYPIYHQPGALEFIKDIIIALNLADFQPIIITSDKLQSVLEKPIKMIRDILSINCPVVTIKDGEEYKNQDTVNHIHDAMFRLGLTRKTKVLALGGGCVGDISGFASSIYLRGVPFIQIPTTLLAMVDASVGGKTGIDMPFGKNLVGSFYQPEAVIIDSNLLQTLSREDYSCGMAEVIKHAIIADRDLFFLLKDGNPDINLVIERSFKVKANIVFNDPFENNIRAHVNLGHTFAHAIEKVSNYEIKHGFAVAMGLMLATKLSKRLQLLEEDYLSDLELVLKKYSLPTALPSEIKTADLLDAMKYDKKRDPQGLKLILPKRLGEVCIKYVDEKDIFAA